MICDLGFGLVRILGEAGAGMAEKARAACFMVGGVGKG